MPCFCLFLVRVERTTMMMMIEIYCTHVILPPLKFSYIYTRPPPPITIFTFYAYTYTHKHIHFVIYNFYQFLRMSNSMHRWLKVSFSQVVAGYTTLIWKCSCIHVRTYRVDAKINNVVGVQRISENKEEHMCVQKTSHDID